ncbi:pseudouridine synthase [Mycoplasma simbae]|uniref:pseudouridine synthase n=1 Tax=Mycoplasma simbae TaxID=36744 RepID=UPI0004963A7A|nr:pseudouridine synthase [Mycoplasma simbae]
MRIDKYLAHASEYSRSQIHSLVKKGRVQINGITVTKVVNIDPDVDKVYIVQNLIKYELYSVYLFNKPAGYICANFDANEPTIFDILNLDPNKYFSVGRLDKDTEGLLLITNNGKWSNWVLKPKNHVPKQYYVEVDFEFNEKILSWNDPIPISGHVVKDYEFKFLTSKTCLLTIYEGKFHQVKQMLKFFGYNVTYLKRISFGDLMLPNDLALGEKIKLENDQIKKLKNFFDF